MARKHNPRGEYLAYRPFKKSACERCGSHRKLTVHHRDGKRSNNMYGNLETLCERCHVLEHRDMQKEEFAASEQYKLRRKKMKCFRCGEKVQPKNARMMKVDGSWKDACKKCFLEIKAKEVN